MARTECTDHLGNVFPSILDKCKHYGISAVGYRRRIKSGWSEEDALTIPPAEQRLQQCTDHLGNIFPSITAKCNHYKVSVSGYRRRIKSGWSEEDALTIIPTSTEQVTKDHLGNIFPSISDKCKHYKISIQSYKSRIKLGWTEEKALTTSHKSSKYIEDPITKQMINIEEFCLKYNIVKNQKIYDYLSRYSSVQVSGISLKIPKSRVNIDKIIYNLRIDKRVKIGKDVFECYEINENGSDTFKIMSQEMIDQYCLEQYKKEKGLM